jgi:aldose 1-epimerase
MSGATSEQAGIDPGGRQVAIEGPGARAVITEVGATLRSLDLAGRTCLQGYAQDEVAPSGRGQVLLPWPNRIDHGRYEWGGVGLQVPLNEVSRSTAIHGLVRFAGWDVASAESSRAVLTHRLWPSPGYPFLLDLRITYDVADGALTVTTEARNRGIEVAPFGAGQHPYVLPPGSGGVDACVLRIPAAQALETDERGIPTARRPVDGTPFDFREGRPIGSVELDTAFTDLARDPDGRARVTLAGDDGTVTVWMDEGYPWLQVFTGDDVPAPLTRTAIAVEPMTCPPNAFVTGDSVMHLEPGAVWQASWGIVFDPLDAGG